MKKEKYSLLVPTSMGLRLTPLNRQPVHASDLYKLQITSAETNVASLISFLGLPVKVLTAFVKGHPFAKLIKEDLASRHIDIEGKEGEQGGPHGHRHQINIADSGFGTRGPRVWNDRAGEVALTMSANDFDLERIFGHQGVRVVHLSGLFAALSPSTIRFCLELVKVAKKYETQVCFDLNYRASFWEGRETQLRNAFTAIAETADFLLGNEEDYQLCLGISGPEAGAEKINDKIESFKQMITRAMEQFPNVSVFATTLREVVNANRHRWGAIMAMQSDWYIEEPREIEVLDRIGGGDSFVAGMLYAFLRGWSADKWIQFGWATGALTTTLETDYANPADEEQIWEIYEGNARVKR